MKWFNPMYWETNNKTYAINDFTNLYERLYESLDEVSYNKYKIVKEWVAFHKYVTSNLSNNMKAEELWKKVLNFKRLEYPNLCLLAELIICMSGSNSTVERSFSMLRNMLRDKRLSMHHNTMHMLLQIKLNNKLWSSKEREDILLAALSIFEKKRRLNKITVPLSSCDLEINENEILQN